MATETDPGTRAGLTRRGALALLGAMAWPLAQARGGLAGTELLATWFTGERQFAGRLLLTAEALQVREQTELPTRAHGLARWPDGSVLIAARRPGDWLLRWHPRSGARTWHWVHDDRRLNGHVHRSLDGQSVWTTETDQADARGLIGVRDARTLDKTGEWSTHGMDPHAALLLPAAVGEWPAGTLLVANGGIPTQSETGRSHRDLARMDPSLVALDPRTGALLGQWRLDDPRLSIRHLAYDPVSGCVGVALQAEHDQAAQRQDAPLLATWDGRALRLAPPTVGAGGYAGDICARAGGGFWLSATRSDALLALSAEGVLLQRVALPAASALVSGAGPAWAGGAFAVWQGAGRAPASALRLDNHWVLADA